MIDYLGRAPSRRRLLAGDVPAWIRNSNRAPYITQVMLSAPPWVDLKVLREMQQAARELTKATGHLHVLDHRVPLNHPHVCGLTVPWNLQIIHWRANLSKGNRWHPDQLPLFGDEE
jgi:5-methylcytosine-specific restriction endonuclease McrA